jgi:hypothetical protein
MVENHSSTGNVLPVNRSTCSRSMHKRYSVTCWNCSRPFVTVKRPKPSYFHACSPLCKQQGHARRVFDRLWCHVVQDGDCWMWTASKNPNGYGQISENNKCVLVHKLVFERLRGPVPAGKELDHLCRRPACCSPAHLEAVTHKVNQLRGFSPFAVNARKTHCLRGHLFDEKNTMLSKTGKRECRICRNARQMLKRRASEHGRLRRVPRSGTMPIGKEAAEQICGSP